MHGCVSLHFEGLMSSCTMTWSSGEGLGLKLKKERGP